MSNGLRRRDMRRVQKWGVRHIYDHEITILAWDMGAGKSVTSLTAMDDLLEDGIVRRVLIVAPLLVASATFPDEFDDWGHLNHIDWTLIRAEDEDDDVVAGRKSEYRFARDVIGLDAAEAARWANKQKTKIKEWKRRRLADDRAEVHIVNKEALLWLWDHFGSGKRWPYDMIIVDEASMFKNGRRRTKLKQLSQFGVMAKARKHAKRVVLMTGTPAPKGLRNLWGLAYIADLGERLGTSRTKFEERWFESDYMGWNLTPRDGAEQQITERLSDIMFTLGPDDYPELPPLLSKNFKVDLPRKAMDEYRRFEKTLVSELYDVEAVNNGVLAGKLLQFANGSMYQDDGGDIHIHDEKLHALEEIVEKANGEPVLVGYSFKFDLARIKKRYKKAVVFGQGDVRKTKAAWNAGEIDMLLAHPQSVGHGQNIQFGGNNMVWYGLTPDLELYLQFNKRLHRPGQKRRVTNYHIIARGTYDEEMLPLLSERGQTQDSIMRAFRVNLAERYDYHLKRV
ncbi:SNF2-related protein [Ochrobactrum sp. WV_118_8]